jgi:hypothetical protein
MQWTNTVDLGAIVEGEVELSSGEGLKEESTVSAAACERGAVKLPAVRA